LKNAKKWNISESDKSVPGIGERGICHSVVLSDLAGSLLDMESH